MATPTGMDTVLEKAAAAGLALGLGEEATPADVAVQAWLLAPAFLEDLHNKQELQRRRAFRFFSTDADLVPPFSGPTAAQIAAIEAQLNEFYVAWKRGPGARVFAFPERERWTFLVRHGALCRREGAMEQGRPTTVFFRPQKHAVLIYEPRRGEMGVNCCAVRERKVLLRVFGRCLFGRPDFFPGTAKYSLAPLVRQGRDCLVCRDVPGMQEVRLTQVEFYRPDHP